MVVSGWQAASPRSGTPPRVGVPILRTAGSMTEHVTFLAQLPGRTVLDEPVAETPIYPPLLDDGFVAWPRRAVLRHETSCPFAEFLQSL